MEYRPFHFKPGMAVGLVLGGIFFYLLALRVGVFQGNSAPSAIPASGVESHDTWMNIFQNGKKIGHSHRRLQVHPNGFDLSDQTVMRINTMGMVQDLSIVTRATLNPDLSLQDFDFNLRSSLFSFTASGRATEGMLFVEMDGQQAKIPLERPIYLTASIFDAVDAADMSTGGSRTFSVFDPATLGRRPVRITLLGREEVTVSGKKIPARKFAVDYMGSAQTAWLDDSGRVIQEKGAMGMTLKRVSRAEALDEATLSASEDLTRLAAVTVDRPLPDPTGLNRLSLRIHGIESPLDLDGGRQSYKDGILTLSLEALPDPEVIDKNVGAEFLAPAPFIESDHPKVRAVLERIVKPGARPLERVRAILEWIRDNIEKRPVLSVPDALATLTNRMGDCNEHAVLFAAMARCAGIPTRVEAGLVYLDGKFFYHAWNGIYLGKWITVDALMNQLPADVTHIRFIRGAADRQLDLVQVMGKIRFALLEPSQD